MAIPAVFPAKFASVDDFLINDQVKKHYGVSVDTMISVSDIIYALEQAKIPESNLQIAAAEFYVIASLYKERKALDGSTQEQVMDAIKEGIMEAESPKATFAKIWERGMGVFYSRVIESQTLPGAKGMRILLENYLTQVRYENERTPEVHKRGYSTQTTAQPTKRHARR